MVVETPKFWDGTYPETEDFSRSFDYTKLLEKTIAGMMYSGILIGLQFKGTNGGTVTLTSGTATAYDGSLIVIDSTNITDISPLNTADTTAFWASVNVSQKIYLYADVINNLGYKTDIGGNNRVAATSEIYKLYYGDRSSGPANLRNTNKWVILATFPSTWNNITHDASELSYNYSLTGLTHTGKLDPIGLFYTGPQLIGKDAIFPNTIENDQIANIHAPSYLGIQGSKIADKSIEGIKLVDNSIGTANIQDGSVTTDKIADYTILTKNFNREIPVSTDFPTWRLRPLRDIGTGAITYYPYSIYDDVTKGNLKSISIMTNECIRMGGTGTGYDAAKWKLHTDWLDYNATGFKSDSLIFDNSSTLPANVNDSFLIELGSYKNGGWGLDHSYAFKISNYIPAKYNFPDTIDLYGPMWYSSVSGYTNTNPVWLDSYMWANLVPPDGYRFEYISVNGFSLSQTPLIPTTATISTSNGSVIIPTAPGVGTSSYRHLIPLSDATGFYNIVDRNTIRNSSPNNNNVMRGVFGTNVIPMLSLYGSTVSPYSSNYGADMNLHIRLKYVDPTDFDFSAFTANNYGVDTVGTTLAYFQSLRVFKAQGSPNVPSSGNPDTTSRDIPIWKFITRT